MTKRPLSGEELTREAFMDLLVEIFPMTRPVEPMTLRVSIPMANRLNRIVRRANALKALGIPHDSPKARRVRAVGNRWS